MHDEVIDDPERLETWNRVLAAQSGDQAAMAALLESVAGIIGRRVSDAVSLRFPKNQKTADSIRDDYQSTAFDSFIAAVADFDPLAVGKKSGKTAKFSSFVSGRVLRAIQNENRSERRHYKRRFEVDCTAEDWQPGEEDEYVDREELLREAEQLKRDIARVPNVLAKLPPKYRDVVESHLMREEPESLRSIAERHDTTHKTISNWLKHAVDSLREMMEETRPAQTPMVYRDSEALNLWSKI